MKAVKHPNCVRFIECYESSGKFYIVMVQEHLTYKRMHPARTLP